MKSPQSKEWLNAMKQEINDLKKQGTWSIVKRTNQKKITVKWVFKIKYNSKNEIIKYKARLVARGFQQIKGIDYETIFSPVARASTIRYVCALSAHYNLEMHHLDFKNAFVQSTLSELIYIEVPDGFSDLLPNENYCLKLEKSLYGLKQASYEWNKTISTFLISIKFVQSVSEPCLYYCINKNIIQIILLYVDDIIIASNSLDEMNFTKQKLRNNFEIEDLGKLKYYLSLQFEQDLKKKQIVIHQSTYSTNIAKEFNLLDANPKYSPGDISMKISKEDCPQSLEDKESMSKTPFQELIGKINYLTTNTRPDCCYSLSKLSRYMHNYGKNHWQAAKHLATYIKTTKDLGLVFNGSKPLDLIGYSDADWAGDKDKQCSTTGWVFTLGGTPISWLSKLQEVPALSTAEAEYIALSNATQEAIYLRKLLQEFNHFDVPSTIIYEDNNSAIQIAENSSHHSRTRHIATRHHFIRHYISIKDITLKPIPTQDNLADLFTKILPAPRHKLLTDKLLSVVAPITDLNEKRVRFLDLNHMESSFQNNTSVQSTDLRSPTS